MAEMMLSPAQKEIIETWGVGMAVLAGAGSGKTTTLVLKCAELLKRNPKACFAAVSFTERSASDLKDKLSASLDLSSSSPHWIMTIHGLCAAILREFPKEGGYDGEETMLSEVASKVLWEEALETLWSENLPLDLAMQLERLFERETRRSVFELLTRIKSLSGFGLLDLLLKSEDEDSRILAQIAKYVLEKYERLKRRQCALDFDDLERGAARALESESVRRTYHGRFDLVLVDEFQDTNLIQSKIIDRLVKPDRSNLCVVGDPKQSIYRFRDAEVEVFQEFCKTLPKNFYLNWNFRSRPGIIDYVNQVCDRVFHSGSYESLEARRESVRGLEPVARLDVETPTDLANWILAENARGIPYEEMTFLLRQVRGGGEKWIRALAASGIPLSIGGGGRFWEDPRVREIISFLKWWVNPAQSLSGAAFLRAPWVGVPDLVLDHWIVQDPTWVKPFFASDHVLAHALLPLKDRVLSPAELLMALLASEEIEAEIGAQILALWHRAQELSLRGLEMTAVVDEFSRAMEEKRRERDVPPPKNIGQLSVLTIHSSKGLEFPHVILADFGPKPRQPNSPLLFWDRKRGACLGKRDEEGVRDKKAEAEWRALEREKNIAESKRLFYVALTRAKERLILICAKLDDDEIGDTFDEDHWRTWIERGGPEVPRISLENKSVRNPSPRKTWNSPKKNSPPPLILSRHSVTEWTSLARCSRQYEWKFRPPERVASFQSEGSRFPGISITELGSTVHEILETGEWERLAELETNVGKDQLCAKSVIDWASHSEWMRPSDPEREREVWSELGFEIPIEGEILVGSIDRLVRVNRALTLIDFKVTGSAKTEAELLTAYQVQVELYAWALRKLDPELSSVRAFLVHIYGNQVREIEVRLQGENPAPLAREASRIVSGGQGRAAPSTACRVCEYRSHCQDGLSYV